MNYRLVLHFPRSHYRWDKIIKMNCKRVDSRSNNKTYQPDICSTGTCSLDDIMFPVFLAVTVHPISAPIPRPIHLTCLSQHIQFKHQELRLGSRHGNQLAQPAGGPNSPRLVQTRPQRSSQTQPRTASARTYTPLSHGRADTADLSRSIGLTCLFAKSGLVSRRGQSLTRMPRLGVE